MGGEGGQGEKGQRGRRVSHAEQRVYPGIQNGYCGLL